MAINVSFNGATIYKPGAYSKTSIDLGGGFPLGPAGLIAVLGEADAGTPGASEVNIANNRFSGDQLSSIRSKYRSGPILDAANFLFAPASDAAIPSGAQTVWFYKTNASVRAELALATTYGTLRSREWGIGGNRLSAKVTLMAETAPQKTGSNITIGDGSAFDSKSFSVRKDGEASATVVTLSAVMADHDTIGELVAEIQAELGADYVVSAPTATTLKIALAAGTNLHRDGKGRSLELIDSTPGHLAVFGLTAGLSVAAIEPAATITLAQKRDNQTDSSTVGGHVVLTAGRDGTGGVTSASVEVTSDSIILNENASPVYTIVKSSFQTLKQVVDEINLQSGWLAALADSQYNQLSPEALDEVDAEAFHTVAGVMPARIKKDAAEVQDMMELSSLAEIVDPGMTGLPDALSETLLTGGARGATTSADIVAALEKFEKFHVNAVVPLFSRDATDDIADGLTDASSSYTIAGVHQAVKTHLSLMKTTKKRSERQGYLSLRDSYVDCKTAAGDLADARIQLAIQDIRQQDSQGTIKWFQPWALSCLLAGARGGAPIGEPLTFKFLNASGIRHTAQPLSTPEADIVIDFDPDLQADDAIQAGLTFMEAPQTGGFRVVVDNTTYGVDNNFVFNRANVLYAADIVAFNFRNAMEATFVGRKNTVSVADVAGVATQILGTFLAQGITVSTPDAPQGFKSLVVRIEGNTIYVEVTIKIVEGIDFVLADISIQRAISG